MIVCNMKVDEFGDDWVGILYDNYFNGDGDDLDEFILWVEIKKQVKILCEVIDDGNDEDGGFE